MTARMTKAVPRHPPSHSQQKRGGPSLATATAATATTAAPSKAMASMGGGGEGGRGKKKKEEEEIDWLISGDQEPDEIAMRVWTTSMSAETGPPCSSSSLAAAAMNGR